MAGGRLKGISTKRAFDRAAEASLAVTALIVSGSFLLIISSLVYYSLPFFREAGIIEFLLGSKWTVLFREKHFGILPLLAGTLLTSMVAIAVAAVAGLASAVYLSEYARPSVRRMLKPCLEVLAGIPTVVYGYLAIYYITPALKALFPSIETHNALAAGIAMGIMITPTVASISEDSMYRVPASLRLAAYSLGATKAQVVTLVVLRAAMPGIIAAFILGLARAIGETMIVTIAAGFRPVLTLNPLEPIQTLTSYIAQVSTGDAPHGTIEYYSLFAVGLYLLLVVLAFNTIGLLVSKRYSARIGGA